MSEELWGPISVNDFSKIPHISNRIAIEKDVQEGRAVFYVNDSADHFPIDMKIPVLAYQVDGETGVRTLAVIIQAERVEDEKIIGLRYLDGGNGVCMLSELEIHDLTP